MSYIFFIPYILFIVDWCYLSGEFINICWSRNVNASRGMGGRGRGGTGLRSWTMYQKHLDKYELQEHQTEHAATFTSSRNTRRSNNCFPCHPSPAGAPLGAVGRKQNYCEQATSMSVVGVVGGLTIVISMPQSGVMLLHVTTSRPIRSQ